MALDGALVNAAATGLAAACYLFAGVEVYVQKRRERQSQAAAAFLLVVGTLLALGSARQVAASQGMQQADLAIFYVSVVPAALAIVPLAHLTTQLLSGSRRLADLVAAAFAAAAVTALGFAYAAGFGGPYESEWGTDWTLESAVARVITFFGLTVPGIVAAGLIVASGLHAGGPQGQRAALLGLSCGIYYGAFTADAFGLSGLALIVSRLLIATAAIVAYAAYGRPVPGAEPAPQSI